MRERIFFFYFLVREWDEGFRGGESNWVSFYNILILVEGYFVFYLNKIVVY